MQSPMPRRKAGPCRLALLILGVLGVAWWWQPLGDRVGLALASLRGAPRGQTVLPRDVRALAPPGRAAVLLMAADRPGAGAHLGLVFDETLSDAAPGLEPSTVDAVASMVAGPRNPDSAHIQGTSFVSTRTAGTWGGETPGLVENAKFTCDRSVSAWQQYGDDVTDKSAQANLGRAAEKFRDLVQRGGEGARYAAAAGLRMSYFATNAVLGLGASSLSDRVNPELSEEEKARGFAVTPDVAGNIMLEAAMTFEQDFAAVSEGEYKMPWDMVTLSHRQYSPFFALQQTARFVRESVATLGRRKRLDAKDYGVWLDAAPDLYPEYYKNNFHFQSDGWMSSSSADVYETSTETLFLGRQDAMQRQSLRPLSASKVGAMNGGKPAILEVACGTGRVATFIRDNFPQAAFTAVDLSPFYLEQARENDEHWRSQRAPSASPAKFVQAGAEKLPFPDESFDAAVNVYMFHEIPASARAAAAAELARVVKPGGVVVWTDSVQKGDRPALDSSLGSFGELNEPHYRGYIETHVGELFEAHGLVFDRKYVASTSKTLSFRKPPRALEPAEADAGAEAEVAGA